MSAEPALAAWPAGYGRIVLDETDSTNAEAARLAPTLAGPTWILAHRQTAAHGRRGRPWAMAPGNFAASLVLRPDGPPGAAALRSFATALALHDALAALTGRPGALALKWPNDVLLNGGKVAGILLESAGSGTGLRHLVIGIGVNLADAPAADQVEPGATRPVSVLGETGLATAPETFLDLLAPAFARWEDQFTRLGFAPLRNAWLARAARLGQPLTARTGSAVHEGIFETIDDGGALVLVSGGRRTAIPAADVYF